MEVGVEVLWTVPLSFLLESCSLKRSLLSRTVKHLMVFKLQRSCYSLWDGSPGWGLVCIRLLHFALGMKLLFSGFHRPFIVTY